MPLNQDSTDNYKTPPPKEDYSILTEKELYLFNILETLSSKYGSVKGTCAFIVSAQETNYSTTAIDSIINFGAFNSIVKLGAKIYGMFADFMKDDQFCEAKKSSTKQLNTLRQH